MPPRWEGGRVSPASAYKLIADLKVGILKEITGARGKSTFAAYLQLFK
jgi:hypothetical protein